MNEKRNDGTIGNLRTWGPDGLLPEEEPMAGASGRNPAQTIGELETLRPEDAREMLLAGRYRAVRRLGEGGMGSVWLAEDTKLDGRLVAIKMLPAVLAGKKGAYRQVKQEALVAMKLSHPNIATVRAFEEDEGGTPFLVMDYIEGEGLDEILSERGPLGEEEVLKLLGPVAAALDYAHSQGVVHRDVKPGNVMVRKDGTPFVLDFGIAREIHDTMTRVTGKFSSGTLLYMSPEQLRGRAPKAAQDVYSFAAMAYECLAGHPPFYRGAVEDQIKNEPPEELEEGVASAGLRKGIMAGLAKMPEGRPGSCMGVLANGGVSTPCEPENGTTGEKAEQGGNGGKMVTSGQTRHDDHELDERIRRAAEFERWAQRRATARPEERSLGLLFGKPSLWLFRVLTGMLVILYGVGPFPGLGGWGRPWNAYSVVPLTSLMCYAGLLWLSCFPKKRTWGVIGWIIESLAALGCFLLIGFLLLDCFRSFFEWVFIPLLLFLLSFPLFVFFHMKGKRRWRNLSAWILSGFHLYAFLYVMKDIVHLGHYNILVCCGAFMAAVVWFLLACREGDWAA